MGNIPDTEKKDNDVVDLLTEAAHKVEPFTNEQGLPDRRLVLDPKQIWCETRLVNRPFGRFTKLLENLEAIAIDCYNNMTKERADVMSKQIMLQVEGYRYAIDSKSSETYRDKNNIQHSLIHVLGRDKSERYITIKGEKKRAFMDMLTGKEADRERDEV